MSSAKLQNKINTQICLASLYTDNEQSKEEIKTMIPFIDIIESKRIKYLGINLTKETKDLYTKNYKTMLNEIEEDTSK